MENIENAPEAVSRQARTTPALRAQSGGDRVVTAAWRRVLGGMLAREIQDLVTSLRFRVTLLLTLSLMVLSALTSALRYQAEAEDLDRLAAEHTGAVEEIALADLLEELYPAFKSPWKLAFLADGQQRWNSDVYLSTLNLWRHPRLGRRHDVEPRLDARETLDWVFVIRVILPMVAFILGYDATCGKKQRALLAMVLSYPVQRWQVLAAKLLAVWTCSSAPFVLGAGASLLLLSTYGGMRFSAAELVKSGLLVVVGLWAVAFFAALAVWVSVLARESARSLAILALLWVTTVVVIPGAGGLLAKTVQPLPTDQEVSRRLREIGEEVVSKHGWPGISDPRIASRDGYASERATVEIQNLRYRLQEDERRRHARDQLARVELANNLASLSPMFLVQDLAERLVGSGPARDRYFLAQAWEFGDRLAATVLVLDGQDPASPRLWENLEHRGPGGHTIRFLPGFVSERTIGPAELPVFEFRERSVREGLAASASRLELFGLVTAMLLVVLWSSFQRHDVGSPRGRG